MVKIKDLWAAAFVKSKGVKLLGTNKEGRSVIFIFEDGARDAILNYQNGAEISAILFKSSVDDLKSIIYDFDFMNVNSN